MSTLPNWYAVYTRSRWEKKVAERLTEKGIINYCPLNKVVRQWHDRKKIIMEPLFRSYVFVRIDLKDQLPVLETNGIVNFVYWLGKPALIKDEEIQLIRQFIHEYTNVRVEKENFQINDMVMVSGGPLISQEGRVVEIKKKTVKLSLTSLRVALVAEVDRANVVKKNKAIDP
jgi:transcription antitermination factor NusG